MNTIHGPKGVKPVIGLPHRKNISVTSDKAQWKPISASE